MKERDGLYYPDGSYLSRAEITDKLRRQRQLVIHHTPINVPPQNFLWWSDLMRRRQEERQEAFAIPNHVVIELPAQEPAGIFFFGDVHGGGEDVDYERFEQDVAFVRDRPNTYAFALGDLVDAYFFNPAQHEHLANLAEQYEYMRSALGELKGKLLVGWGGDHDLWSTKMGVSFYHRFRQDMDAHYMEGVGYVDLIVGGQNYRLSAAHRHNGFSIYNEAHASHRLYRDDAEGTDIVITAHNHRKAINQQTIKEFGGGSRVVYYLSLGSYKFSDAYSRKKGFSRQANEQMGASGVILHPDERAVETVWTI